MRYNTGSFDIFLLTDNHRDGRTDRDRDAEDALKAEIEALIDSNDDYRRIAPLGVSGGSY